MASSKRRKESEGQSFLFGPPGEARHASAPAVAVESPVWTQCKALLIERYLYLFVQITHHGAYIDGFAGPQRSNKPDMWAAKLVLESQPAFLRHFYLYDKSAAQVDRLNALVNELPASQKLHPRSIDVSCGDFNEKVHELLRTKKIGEKEATFCLLDQRTFECKWSTVSAIAQYRTTGYKIEVFYFLPIYWLWRAMAALKKNPDILVEWWGRNDIDVLRGVRQLGLLELFERRFREELGYKHVVSWPIFSKQRKVMYYMIHCTDHDAAAPLMQRAYKMATQSGVSQLSLF